MALFKRSALFTFSCFDDKISFNVRIFKVRGFMLTFVNFLKVTVSGTT